jgi:hypothetical protein
MLQWAATTKKAGRDYLTLRWAATTKRAERDHRMLQWAKPTKNAGNNIGSEPGYDLGGGSKTCRLIPH